MDRNDIIGLIGLVLLVGGIGGGFELTYLSQSVAYHDLAAAGPLGADPATFARDMEKATFFIKAGIPLGMAGAVLLTIAVRGYLSAIRRRDGASGA